MKKIAVTGHRPMGLWQSRDPYSEEKTKCLLGFADKVIEVLKSNYDDFTILSGMAIGWDQAITKAAIEAGVPVIAYLPFKGQEVLWPRHVQVEYTVMLAECKEIILCSDTEKFHRQLMLNRNIRLVQDCQMLVALKNPSLEDSGTAHAVRHAKGLGKEIWNVWEEWNTWKAQF